MSTNITDKERDQITEQLRNIDAFFLSIENEELQKSRAPQNGYLSGMIITGGAAVVVVIWGLFFTNYLSPFLTDPSPTFLNALFISIIIIALHKVESYYAEEYNHCPVYLTQGRSNWAQNNRQAIFLAFVCTFLVLTMGIYFAIKGQPWTMLIPIIWLAQGLHEQHHLAKSFAQRGYYPGTITSLLFVLQINFMLFPAWWDSLTIINDYLFYLYYLVQPIILLAFYFEHRHFLRLYSVYQKAQKYLQPRKRLN